MRLEKVVIKGEGTLLENNSRVLKNRAKRKVISQKMVLSLVDIAKEKGDIELEKSYWNTYHCQNKLMSHKGKLHGTYCKNRFCTLCLSIRKADIINRYYPVMKNWEDPHFVTLTVKAVGAKNLNKWIKGMKKAFKQVHQRCKKRHQRGKGIKLIGIKSLECNFNPQRKTYNPHYHIIVSNKEMAEVLKKEWIQLWTTKHTYHKAQHIRKVESLEHDLIETIKYGSKIFTEPDLKKKMKQSLPPMIYAKALDTIFAAMKEVRIFDRFGFDLPQQEKPKPNIRFVNEVEEWIFDSHSHDWYNSNTGEILTSYKHQPQLEFLLSQCINKKSF